MRSYSILDPYLMNFVGYLRFRATKERVLTFLCRIPSKFLTQIEFIFSSYIRSVRSV